MSEAKMSELEMLEQVSEAVITRFPTINNGISREFTGIKIDLAKWAVQEIKRLRKELSKLEDDALSVKIERRQYRDTLRVIREFVPLKEDVRLLIDLVLDGRQENNPH